MNILFVVWGPERATGIAILDEHRRSIVSTMNSLFYFMRTRHGHTAVAPTITILEQYIKLHFFAEERLLRESAYVGYSLHAEQHDKIMKRMTILAAKLRRSGEPDPLLEFLKDWWNEHIEVQDRKYLDHLKAYLQGGRTAEDPLLQWKVGPLPIPVC